MNNWLYTLYALILGIIALWTGEIVTFAMLGFILLCLQNIYTILRKIHRTLENKQGG